MATITISEMLFLKSNSVLKDLPSDAINVDAVNRAWRQWALKNHPDKDGDPAIFTNMNNIVEKMRDHANIRKYVDCMYPSKRAPAAPHINPPLKSDDSEYVSTATYDPAVFARNKALFKERMRNMAKETPPPKAPDAPPQPSPPKAPEAKPKKPRKEKKPDTEEKIMYLNVTTGRYVKKGSVSFKSYVKTGYIIDHEAREIRVE